MVQTLLQVLRLLHVATEGSFVSHRSEVAGKEYVQGRKVEIIEKCRPNIYAARQRIENKSRINSLDSSFFLHANRFPPSILMLS